jgi:hypothetical protein
LRQRQLLIAVRDEPIAPSWKTEPQARRHPLGAIRARACHN